MPCGDSERFSRSRTGCLQCRRKHEKCDEQHPTCLLCSQRGLTCQWPSTLKWIGKAQPTVSRHRSRRRAKHIDAGPPSPTPALPSNNLFDSDDEQCAWEYYVRLVSSNVPALDGPDNPYRHISFTALSTPILRETIICIAAEHMLNFGLGSISTAARQQQRMLRTIGQNLALITGPGPRSTEPSSVTSTNKLDHDALLTAVVLQGVVVVQSEHGVLEPHVRCASFLMATLGRFHDVPASPSARMTVQRYAMVDLMLAISRQRRPYAPRSFVLHTPDANRWDGSEPSFHKMNGCPQPLMCFLVRIAHLAADMNESPSSTPEILGQAYRLETELRAWGGGARYTSPSAAGSGRDALDILSECFYWTAHLLLARRVFRDATRSRRVQHLARTCFGLMNQLATGCGPDSSLPQPFYLAAREAVSVEERAWVRQKHEAMTAFYREQQRNLAMRLTERVWEITDQAETVGSVEGVEFAMDTVDQRIKVLDEQSWFFIF